MTAHGTPVAHFFDADGNPVPQGDPTADTVEITETWPDGRVVRTYGRVHGDQS